MARLVDRGRSTGGSCSAAREAWRARVAWPKLERLEKELEDGRGAPAEREGGEEEREGRRNVESDEGPPRGWDVERGDGVE